MVLENKNPFLCLMNIIMKPPKESCSLFSHCLLIPLCMCVLSYINKPEAY